MHNSLLKTIKIAIISVYLIFIAGSVVRMTGSGMGCPDWPKCFGYTIPPTSEEELTWKPNTEYAKGIIIIKNEALFVATEDLKSSSTFNKDNWEAYTKHEYATFNVYHTWTEYVNRLSSVLSGFVFLVLLFKVTFNKNKIKGVATLVYFAFLGMLFEAWLGKIVVDSFLTPYIITIHMIGGLLIIGLLLRARFLVDRTINNVHLSKSFITNNNQKTFKTLLIVSLLMMTAQILLGTQIRQYVDEQVKIYGFQHKEFRLLNPSFKFYFHRSFTIAVVLVNAFLFWINYKYKLGYNALKWVLGLLFFEAFTGILMYYVNFPFGTQAVHLLSGALLYGILLYIYFNVSNRISKS